ncbi:MAG: cupin domain-containing protein [candidate division KSB1 bacterium]|nr:cupin domain-containing protein [candidate division KSB1 bacterium]MDZ7301552.1 cupin domain-containing protein [candidate division KSB1 bacterium]MDZ7311032.1 cupin domain-containing protein [candidate division KSB1 bacterium]
MDNPVKNEANQPSAKKIPSGVLNPAELLAYQNGAVVSRTIINKTTGTVTLFAFDQGEGLSEHTAPYDALVYMLEGEAEIIISGISHRLHAGEMILMPAGEPHALKAIQQFKMLLTMIKS